MLVPPDPAPATERPTLRVGPIELDLQAPTVRFHRQTGTAVVDLPITEHRLLAFLLQTPGHARTREAICRGVWPATPVDVRTVDQYVRRLRRSLQRAGAAPIVQTLNRYGYRVEPALPPLHAPHESAHQAPTPAATVTPLSRAISTVTPFQPIHSPDRS